MSLRDDILDFFRNEGRVLRLAPCSFTLAVIAIAALIFGVEYSTFSWRYAGQLENKDTTITAKDAIISEYKEKLNGLTPTEAAKQITDLQNGLASLQKDVRDIQQHPSGSGQPGISYRRLSNDEIENFKKIGTIYTGEKPIVEVGYNLVCLDCQGYSDDFIKLINSIPGWQTTPGRPAFMGPGYPIASSGVTIFVKDTNNLTPPEQIIASGLTAAGLTYNIVARSIYAPANMIQPNMEISINPQKG